ncbi:hypothetical protein E2C01_052877 [Portunus trituberculatus]|uniref:Uncharacterized protein n=1 Tax=Portunus trituberculatus TaxID=210409 RepID=A0A5B7GNM6_PORTR|nr:hypothetical protein [Portunus trituberculatus]
MEAEGRGEEGRRGKRVGLGSEGGALPAAHHLPPRPASRTALSQYRPDEYWTQDIVFSLDRTAVSDLHPF